MQELQLKFTYDKEANAAYIYLPRDDNESVDNSLEANELPVKLSSSLIFDLDKEGRLRGIEILEANQVLKIQK